MIVSFQELLNFKRLASIFEISSMCEVVLTKCDYSYFSLDLVWSCAAYVTQSFSFSSFFSNLLIAQ